MAQYCRYCVHAIDYNGEGTEFICEANAPCGNNGAGQFYPAAKAKRVNHCKHFELNEIDVFGGTRADGTFKTYSPRGPRQRAAEQLHFEEERENE